MRGMKETVLIKLSGSSAAYIPFVKIFLVMPISVLLGIFYLYVRNASGVYGVSRSYYMVSALFLGYFALFTFHILPNIHLYTANPDWIAATQAQYPYAKYLLGITGNLPSALYYVFAELWGTFTLVIMFWSMANDSFTTQQASRIYPIISTVSSIGVIASSKIIDLLSRSSIPLEHSTIFILSLGCLMSILVYMLNPMCRKALAEQEADAEAAKAGTQESGQKKKKRMPFLKSLQTAIQTPHVLYIAICVVSFSVLINIVETSLKEKLYSYYSETQSYLAYYSYFTQMKGILSLLANICNVYLLRRFGWFYIAMITPVFCILTVNILISHNAGIFPSFLLGLFQTDDITYTVMWLGVYGMTATYAAKYAFFDTTKDMAFILLPEDIRANGKAAADGIGGRLGKSGSGAILAALLSFTAVESSTNDMMLIAPYLIVVTCLLSLMWLWAMSKLTASYYQRTGAIKQQASESDEKAPTDRALVY